MVNELAKLAQTNLESYTFPPSKDDNPQKLDNRVKELFKEHSRLSRYMTNSLRKLTQMIINLIVTRARGVSARCKVSVFLFRFNLNVRSKCILGK